MKGVGSLVKEGRTIWGTFLVEDLGILQSRSLVNWKVQTLKD